MSTQIEVVFCLCDDMHSWCCMPDADVMTTAIVAMLYFGGNMHLASRYLCEHENIPNKLSRSRFNRRLYWITDLFLIANLGIIGYFFHEILRSTPWNVTRSSIRLGLLVGYSLHAV